MTRRQIVTGYWLVLLLFGVTALGAFHQGMRRGIAVGIQEANSTESVAAGIHAAELIQALDKGRNLEVRRGLDLIIDSAIATHYLRLQAPDAMGGAPDPSLQWHYDDLLDHRRRSPSTSQTKHIGIQVAAALGR